MSRNQTHYYLALHQITSLGPVNWQRLIDYFPDVEAAWQAPAAELRPVIGPRLAEPGAEARPRNCPGAQRGKINLAGV